MRCRVVTGHFGLMYHGRAGRVEAGRRLKCLKPPRRRTSRPWGATRATHPGGFAQLRLRAGDALDTHYGPTTTKAIGPAKAVRDFY